MLSKVFSASVIGVKANVVQVETDVSNGIPSFIMTGYVGARVREAGDRVRTAIKNIGYKMPSSKIIVNVSPASIRKSGTMLDLPVAVGILCNMEVISKEYLQDTLIVGELSLDGMINPICGILSIVDEAKQVGIKRCIIPMKNLEEAVLIKGIEVLGVKSLEQVVEILCLNNTELEKWKVKHNVIKEKIEIGKKQNPEVDFADVRGQFAAKRALLIAAAGKHNILMAGPPGSGKTLLASRLPTILPELNITELIDIYKIYSVAGKHEDIKSYISKRPFRSPHHTISQPTLLGGGIVPVPGEISLAHNGVLFLDELTKFKSSVLESLRQPIEECCSVIIRNGEICRFPANFMLVAAMNPCKCGYFPDRNMCRCTQIDIIRHVGKLSRPFLDRFDMSVHIDKPMYDELTGGAEFELNNMIKRIRENENNYYQAFTSQEMKKKVATAVDIQRKRQERYGIIYNSKLNMSQIKKFCEIEKNANELLKEAYEKYNLSARGYAKVLKVARTIADIEESNRIEISHLSEAICFRNIDLEG